MFVLELNLKVLLTTSVFSLVKKIGTVIFFEEVMFSLIKFHGLMHSPSPSNVMIPISSARSLVYSCCTFLLAIGVNFSS